MSSPTARSLAYLRQSGFTAEVCERWIPRANVRRDLFRIADIVAAHPIRKEIVLVQTTSLSNLPAHVTKAKGRAELATWLQAGGQFHLHGWSRRAGRWEVKVLAIGAEDLATVVITKPTRRGGGRGHRQRTLFDDAPAIVAMSDAPASPQPGIGRCVLGRRQPRGTGKPGEYT